MTDLLVDWCSYAAAKYAVEKWHYSGVMPAGKTVKLGVWEGGHFIGAVVFSRGANRNIGKPYNLPQTAVCELVRVALTDHTSPVSKIVAQAVRMLQVNSPGVRLLISYADPREGHTGTIYQAMNWIYTGISKPQAAAVINGAIVHKRTVHSTNGTLAGQQLSEVLWKHKYLYPLDRAMRRQIAPLAQPYPKRDMRPANGSNQATSPARRFDSDPAA